MKERGARENVRDIARKRMMTLVLTPLNPRIRAIADHLSSEYLWGKYSKYCEKQERKPSPLYSQFSDFCGLMEP
jgi:hypothetical protein